MFTASTYYRQFELYNAALWPRHHLLGLALALVARVVRNPPLPPGRRWSGCCGRWTRPTPC